MICGPPKTSKNVHKPQNTYFGTWNMNILEIWFQNSKNIKKMEPVLLRILCQIGLYTSPNGLMRDRNNEKPNWVKIHKHCKNAVTI